MPERMVPSVEFSVSASEDVWTLIDFVYDSQYLPATRDRVKDASVLDAVVVSLDASSRCEEMNLSTHMPNFGIQGQCNKCNTVAGGRHYHSGHHQQAEEESLCG